MTCEAYLSTYSDCFYGFIVVVIMVVILVVGVVGVVAVTVYCFLVIGYRSVVRGWWLGA